MKRNHSDSPTDGHEDKKPHISVQKLTDDPSLGKINCHRSLLPEMGVDPTVTLEQRLTRLEGQFLELEQKLKARDDELMSVRLLNQDLERQLSQANGAILTQAQSVPDALPLQPVEEMEVTSVPSSVNSSVALTLTTATSTNTNTSTSTSTSPTSTSATSTSAIYKP